MSNLCTISNADFNVNILDSKKTFHNTGSIEIVTPADGIKPWEPIKRLEKIPPESEIGKKGNILLEIYSTSAGVGFEKIKK